MSKFYAAEIGPERKVVNVIVLGPESPNAGAISAATGRNYVTSYNRVSIGWVYDPAAQTFQPSED